MTRLSRLVLNSAPKGPPQAYRPLCQWTIIRKRRAQRPDLLLSSVIAHLSSVFCYLSSGMQTYNPER